MKLEQKEPAGLTERFIGAQRNKWEAFAIVAVGIFMANLDTSIVNVSILAIARAFGTTLTHGMRNEIKASKRQSLLFETKKWESKVNR